MSKIVITMDEMKLKTVKDWLKRSRAVDSNESRISFFHSIESALDEINSNFKIGQPKKVRYAEICDFSSAARRITQNEYNLLLGYSIAIGKVSLDEVMA